MGQGLVLARYGQQAEIETDTGAAVQAHLRRNQPVVVGDKVEYDEVDGGSVVVTACLPRRSLMTRLVGKQQKPVAANITCMAIMMAVEPKPSRLLLDSYIVAAENLGITPIIIFNKFDLAEDDDARMALEMMQYSYYQLGYSATIMSAMHQQGIQDFMQVVKAQTVVIVGQSGVGKSSLINALQPEHCAMVGELSQLEQGKHTTTTARLYHLDDGVDLIDSPGIREYRLDDMTAEQLQKGFVEFEPLREQCKFRDCCHLNEPDCAVLAAAEQGKIDSERLASYHQLLAQCA